MSQPPSLKSPVLVKFLIFMLCTFGLSWLIVNFLLAK